MSEGLTDRVNKFRWHRGELSASMDTVKEFDGSVSELVSILKNEAWLSNIETSQVKVDPYAYDERIGWDTHLVTVNGSAVGFTDGPIVIG